VFMNGPIHVFIGKFLGGCGFLHYSCVDMWAYGINGHVVVCV